MNKFTLILVSVLLLAGIATFYFAFQFSETARTSTETDTILPTTEPTTVPTTEPSVPTTDVVPEPELPTVFTPTPLNTSNQTNTTVDHTVILKNYHYHVKENPTEYPPLFNVVYASPFLKIALNDRRIFNKHYYDTIYLDRKNQLAIGFCEMPGCPSYAGKGVLLNFYEADLITPDEWLKKVAGGTKEEKGVLLFGRETYLMKKDSISVWVDVFYGLPLRVVEGTADPLYFDYQVINDPNLTAQPKQGFVWDK